MMRVFQTRFLPLIAVLSLGVLVGCTAAPQGGGINDPYEEVNRSWHETNVALDRSVIKPVSTAYGTVVPDPLRKGLSNVSDTLSIPGTVVNDVLQLRLGDALHNTARFAVNATVGIGGLFDPATGMGLEERDSDFGETLYTWGVGEGAYVVLPVYGPSTERDAFGLIVDIALDPVGNLLGNPEASYKTGLKVADLADTRYRYSDLYESLMYDSADSYTQMRLTYLDNRRYELGTPIVAGEEGADQAATYDIYEDFYE
ncbi:VacJ family lipoprotein [Celeribacter ethanolicus]|uniref:MlaA family lipoprotein n=1 Tax=Celeribacter ethanolicus TaxID=1758178 RepID=UPI000B04463B|nr:VacJ family lipoprotein [Celeribacter ethanolicus]